jgi:hypothetical protein
MTNFWTLAWRQHLRARIEAKRALRILRVRLDFSALPHNPMATHGAIGKGAGAGVRVEVDGR